MAEFMSYDAGKLTRVLTRDEWQPNIHNQVATEKTQPAAPEACARIEIACQIDAPRHTGAHKIGNVRDELIKPWMLRWIQLQRFGSFGRSRQDRFEHEEHGDAARNQGSDVEDCLDEQQIKAS